MIISQDQNIISLVFMQEILTHSGQDKMATIFFTGDILKCIFVNQNFDFQIKFNWNIFPRV